jgi:hypothetical protein
VRAALVLAFVLCGAHTATADPPTPMTSPRQRSDSIEAVEKYLRPVLASAGKAGRIYYEAICLAAEDYPLAFPRVKARPPLLNVTDLTAARSVFREDKSVLVTEDTAGIIRVRIGRVPDAILGTRISTLSLDPIEQYNSRVAIGAIEDTPEVRSAMERLRLVLPVRVVNMPVLRPAEGFPHLPPELSNVTMDQALDIVARTWGIVFYGACAERGIYEIF